MYASSLTMDSFAIKGSSPSRLRGMRERGVGKGSGLRNSSVKSHSSSSPMVFKVVCFNTNFVR